MSETRRAPYPLLALAFAVLGGCAVKPVHVFSLVDPAVDASASAAPAYAIAFEAVTVPSAADVPQLVVTTAKGSMNVAENERWAAPLSDEVRSSLSQVLKAKLGVADVTRVPPPAGVRVVHVRVDVQRFEAVESGPVRVAAQWSLREAGATGSALSCQSVASETQSGGYPELVASYRRAVAAIGTQIAARVEAVARGSPTSCP